MINTKIHAFYWHVWDLLIIIKKTVVLTRSQFYSRIKNGVSASIKTIIIKINAFHWRVWSSKILLISFRKNGSSHEMTILCKCIKRLHGVRKMIVSKTHAFYQLVLDFKVLLISVKKTVALKKWIFCQGHIAAAAWFVRSDFYESRIVWYHTC